MVLLLIEMGYQLDEVIFFNTGMEFEAIYNVRDRLIPILEERGIKYTELEPQKPFLYNMLERPVESKQKGCHCGYGWCGGVCRRGTTEKNRIIDEYKAGINDEVYEYVGIAADEAWRAKGKHYPLIDLGMTEAACLAYCWDRGWNWLERTTATETGYIDLYKILDRVSCWCCSNKNRKELKNIYIFLPEYWEKLKFLQSRIDRPMKKWKNARYGEYGRTGKRAKARNMNSAKQWRRTSRFSSSLIGNGRDHRMQKNKMPVPTEAQEQMTLFSWAAMQSGKYPELNLLYHVPNGGSRHKAEAGRLRAEGVKAGVPDLCLPVARGQYHGLYIELKRQRGGRTSDHQSEWLDALSAQGYKAALCYGWEQAAGTIIEYLTGGGTHD